MYNKVARQLNQKIYHKISTLKTLLEEVTHEIQTEIQKLDHESSIDALTGLFRREAFAGEFASRNGKGTFAVLDIDHFKQINDTKGHAYGDEVLRSVGKILGRYASEKTSIGRWGGEEFVFWTVEKSGTRLLEKIHKEIETAGLCTVSMGVTQRVRAESLDLLFQNADQALYQAKKSGRNRMVTRLILAA